MPGSLGKNPFYLCRAGTYSERKRAAQRGFASREGGTIVGGEMMLTELARRAEISIAYLSHMPLDDLFPPRGGGRQTSSRASTM